MDVTKEKFENPQGLFRRQHTDYCIHVVEIQLQRNKTNTILLHLILRL